MEDNFQREMMISCNPFSNRNCYYPCKYQGWFLTVVSQVEYIYLYFFIISKVNSMILPANESRIGRYNDAFSNRVAQPTICIVTAFCGHVCQISANCHTYPISNASGYGFFIRERNWRFFNVTKEFLMKKVTFLSPMKAWDLE